MNHASLANTSSTSSRSTARPPLQIELRFHLALPTDTVFELVTTRLPEWFAMIHEVTWDHARSTRGPSKLGACSERVCDFGGKKLLEEIVEVDFGRSYTYRADLERSTMKMPLAEHLGSFELSASDGGTDVTWRQYFRAKWFVPAAMLRWQMRDKMMRPAVDALIAKHGGRWLPVA